ncbi:MAG: lipocalin-like domain-containing protein [Candidatus Accumulibacter sp.]|uniref:lipocalin-like domain-containing protein n=1 Tax=Accumulibacter sp. TaxID=2053492 RepID=UPI00287AFD2D|nr:lipocalin-like domain-containing protein [Accumulibacter sp.]MDS4015637.1 lipocalin-like domain-containing protein [Accumulibacter sp.]
MYRRTFLRCALLLPTLARAANPATVSPYPAVVPGRRLVFPRDHAAHPEFRTEWWYVTGALDTPQADIGFQLTFFRSRPGIAEGLPSPLAASQILFAHAALSLPGDRLRHSERSARANLGGSFSTDDCDVRIGAWQILREQLSGGEIFRLRMQSAQFAYDLILAPTQPPMLQGEDGYSRKGHAPGLASYYVSWPQLHTTGTLVFDGRRHAASGRAWFDHEWSTAILGGGAVGWDWVGINLADGGALMAFRLRDRHGSTVFAHAAWRQANGQIQRFDDRSTSFTPRRIWSSPRSAARYPVELEIRLGERVLRTLPLLDDQELSTSRPTPVTYWEGLVKLEGSFNGRGYLEMTGYAGNLQL